MTHDFENALRDRAKQLLTTKPPLVLLLHHNDTDGLSAGAIISRSLERAMIPITRYCLEKPYPIVLEQLFADPHLPQETVVLFVDFGSGMLSRIAAANRRRFSVLVLDHHQLEDFSDPAIEVLNCNQHGISGSTGCSASAVAYCFALGLGEWNAKLAHLGVLGALGDSFLTGGELSDLNSELVSLARTQGSVSVNGEYRFQLSQDVGAMQLIACLDALGSVGYYKGGPDIAIKGLLDNQIEALLTSGQQYLDHQHQLFTKFVESSALSVTGELEWFNLTDSFGEVGVKTVGLLCNYLLEQQVASGAHYLAGFQYICDQIPGMGPVEFNQSKLSMRIPHALRPAVESGDLPSLDQLLPAVAGAAGGFVDACHPYAAAVTVGRGAEETFIERLNSALLSYLSLGSE